jgi:hypothetical protein
MGNLFLDELQVIPLHVLHLLLYSPQRLKARELVLIGVLKQAQLPSFSKVRLLIDLVPCH